MNVVVEQETQIMDTLACNTLYPTSCSATCGSSGSTCAFTCDGFTCMDTCFLTCDGLTCDSITCSGSLCDGSIPIVNNYNNVVIR